VAVGGWQASQWSGASPAPQTQPRTSQAQMMTLPKARRMQVWGRTTWQSQWEVELLLAVVSLLQW
jgi:hypothetical protein